MSVRILHGTGASAGIVWGPVHVVDGPRAPSGVELRPGGEDAEVERLAAASAAAAEELGGLADRTTAEGHPLEAAVFAAQALMARDPALLALAEDAIRTGGRDAVTAAREAGEAVAGRLRALGTEIFAGRAIDVIDVSVRIARRAAAADDELETMDRPAVIVAADLLPSMMATLPRNRLLGFVVEGGSTTSHIAILARAYDVPAVVGVDGLRAALSGPDGPAAEVGLDGATGEVFIAPDGAAREELQRRRRRIVRARRRARSKATLPAETRDGAAIALLANIGLPDEIDRAVEVGAQGVGLFRTEFLFLERPFQPDEDEQAAIYGRVLQSAAPHPVTIRLLDVGGDKPIPYLRLAAEANPFLGVRGIRLATVRPEIFVRQLRAVMRAAASVAGPLKVMAPMVADLGDVDLLLDLARQAETGLTDEGMSYRPVQLGAMLEIPASILAARSYLDRLEFASLGTNDLLQYTLAADRGNAALGAYRDQLHPALLRLVAEAVDACRRTNTELSVCGEMAGDPAAALALVGLGVTSLSMVPGSVPAVRRAIRSATLRDLQAAAEAALSDARAADVRARFARLLSA